MAWAWNKAASRYQNVETGQFMARKEVLGYVEKSITASGQATDILASYVADGLLAPGDFYSLMAREVKGEYLRQYMLGRGGRAQMTQADWGSIGGMLKEQYNPYLKNFVNEIAQGRLSEGQIRARARMYINSAREAFERANARARSDGQLELPAYPADGQTVCLTNCNCNWDIVEVYDENGVLVGWDCTWIVNHAVENCPDCLDNEAKWAPYEARL